MSFVPSLRLSLRGLSVLLAATVWLWSGGCAPSGPESSAASSPTAHAVDQAGPIESDGGSDENGTLPPLQPREELEGAEALSLLGTPLYPPELPPDLLADRQARLETAWAALGEAPRDPDALIWVGRRTAYLGRYREAIELFSEGVSEHPEDPRFLRHRGHRYLTLRRPDLAERDLARAAEMVRGQPDRVEPDGLPNARNIPTSTLQSNIGYHLGLARYLQGDFEGALAAYRSCWEVSNNPDMQVATAHWLYMTLRRLGRDAEAAEVLEPISAEMDIIENEGYHRLLLLYQGTLTEEALLAEAGDDALQSATLGYGIGNWHLYNGRTQRAAEVFREILRGEQWAAFGYIAAEAELARQSDDGRSGS